jgi:hypothetical protein
MKNFTQKFIGLLALVFTMSFTVNSQEIGDIYQGGIVFQINENGTGLLADLQDLGQMSWYNAMSAAPSATSQGYDDWYLPSLEELELMYNTIGNGGPEGNIGGFSGFSNSWYWSSSEAPSDYDNAWCVDFDDGDSSNAAKYGTARIRVIRSFGEDEEVATQNIPLDLPQGWSMFGYTCLDSVDAMVGFSSISDKIEIVKDEWGLSYLPSWEFNAMGSLQFSEGYQIKMIEEVTDFQFCTTIAGGASQEELDAAYDNGVASVDITSDNQTAFDEGAASVTPEDGITQADVDAAVAEVEASYAGWCASDIDNDGICDVDEVSGCMDASSCNYVSAAEFDDNSCEYSSCLDECGVMNGDNSTCLDCAGLVNGTSEDLGCGCGNPAAQEGYDCDGNLLIYIGDEAHGGIVFQINEDGTGLVAYLQDLGEMSWFDAMNVAESVTSQGYEDWYLPSIQELSLMYNTIGNGGPEGNIGGFIEDGSYWSSTEYGDYYARYLNFPSGNTNYYIKSTTRLVRPIRAF